MSIRIAIAIEVVGSEEKVAEHFGQCAKFNVCEINEDNKIVKYESYFNPLTGDHGGACQLPGYLNQFNIKAIIAGGMGQRAVTNFQKFGIEVITAPGLKFDDAVNLFIQGKLSGFEVCKHEHEPGHHHEHHHEHEDN
jgi:predicted Fe-Mo cluster-binding NifX family protein